MTTPTRPRSYAGVPLGPSDVAYDVAVIDLAGLTADHQFAPYAKTLQCFITTAGDLVVQTLARENRTIPLPTGAHYLPVGVHYIRDTGTTAQGTVIAYI